jgi:hypothetical protein
MRVLCRLKVPAWAQLMRNSDFRAISLVNGVMFMTMNGSRAVLLPLLAVQGFGLSTTVIGEHFIAVLHDRGQSTSPLQSTIVIVTILSLCYTIEVRALPRFRVQLS